MNGLFENWASHWAAQQQAFLNAMLPAQPAAPETSAASSPLEAQFAELRETWRASIEKWMELAKDGARLQLPSVEALRELIAPTHWSGPGAGVLDAGLRQVLFVSGKSQGVLGKGIVEWLRARD